MRSATLTRRMAGWQYLAAASVLTDFAPETLTSIDGERDFDAVGEMLLLHGSPIHDGPARGRWRLRDSSRRLALSALSDSGETVRALKANEPPENPAQHALTRMLRGLPPADYATASLQDLLGADQAVEWVLGSGPEATKMREELRARIERARLLEPLERLLAHGFAGRRRELKQLRSYVDEQPAESFWEAVGRSASRVADLFRTRPPLMIHGPGGSGKSTLIAKFVSDHAGRGVERPTPFIYLDFDSIDLDPKNLETLLTEAFRQIGVQFPEHARRAQALVDASHANEALTLEAADFARSGGHQASERLTEELGDLLSEISESRGSNVLLFLDTFEAVQRQGTTAAFNVLSRIADLLRATPRLRIVIAGRGELRRADLADFLVDEAPPWRSLHLSGFRDPEAARAYLRARLAKLEYKTAVSDKQLDAVASLVQGNPLSLRLAAQVFAREGMAALDGAVHEARFHKSFFEERLQGFLHTRIVQQLDEPLRALADPGLVVRRLTPDVLRQVLAGPCGIPADQTDVLLAQLRDEVSLVVVEPDGSLRHRSDVRLLMLRDLRKKLGRTAAEIDDVAVAYWASQPGPEARAEEIYHRIWRRDANDQLDEAWRRGPIEPTYYTDIIDELAELDGTDVLGTDPRMRLWLLAKLGRELPRDLRLRAGRLQQEADAERRARSLLTSGSAKEALSVLPPRDGRTPASDVWRVEIEALKLLGEDDAAIEAADAAIDAAGGDASSDFLSDILLKKSSVFERRNEIETAFADACRAQSVAPESDAAQRFVVGVARARLERKMGRDAENTLAELAALLDREAVRAELSDRPALVREAAAELGLLRPDLYVDYAEVLVSDAEGFEESTRRWLGIGAAATELARYQEAVKIFERCVRLAREAESPELELGALLLLGCACEQIGSTQQAESALKEAVELAQRVDFGAGDAAADVAVALWRLKRREEALYQLSRAVELARAGGDAHNAARLLTLFGVLRGESGDSEGALEAFRESRDAASEAGDAEAEGDALEGISLQLAAHGELEEAARAADQGIVIAQEIGEREALARRHDLLSRILGRMGREREAESHAQTARRMSQTGGDRIAMLPKLGDFKERPSLTMHKLGSRSLKSLSGSLQNAVDGLLRYKL